MPDLTVAMNGIEVGKLTMGASGAMSFRYLDSWCERPGARAISLSLPLKRGVFTPAASAVNRSKSDKVPTPEFLRRRQDAIITNWRFAQQIETTVFQHELQRTLGRFRVENWELDLFQHLSERAAQAIYQRGEEPWEWTV